MIKGLDLNKACGHDMINNCMIKLFEVSIYTPLQLICKTGLEQVVFWLCWKKSNVPIHKKLKDSQINEHRPVFFFPM